MRARSLLVVLAVTGLWACRTSPPTSVTLQPRLGEPPGFVVALSEAALERTNHEIAPDGGYHVIDYPGGDIPADRGACTDVVIRAYRALGVDLQRDVHEAMSADFGRYPGVWGLSEPDANIDHRRVLNLEVFFASEGEELPVSDSPQDYQPGDLVTWRIGWRERPHIGVVVDRRSPDGGRFMVVHNIGRGPELADVLFRHPITGHYRYYGKLGAAFPEAGTTPQVRESEDQ